MRTQSRRTRKIWHLTECNTADTKTKPFYLDYCQTWKRGRYNCFNMFTDNFTLFWILSANFTQFNNVCISNSLVNFIGKLELGKVSNLLGPVTGSSSSGSDNFRKCMWTLPLITVIEKPILTKSCTWQGVFSTFRHVNLKFKVSVEMYIELIQNMLWVMKIWTLPFCVN